MTTRILFVGDSITAGAPPGLSLNQTWPGVAVAALQAAGKSVVFSNSGVSGSSAAGWVGTTVGTQNLLWYPQVEAVHSVGYAHSIGVVMLGHNDIAVLTATAAATEDRLSAIARTLKRDNYSPILLVTVPPSSALAGGLETARQAINTWILSASGYPAFDVGTVPQLADPTNATYYVDGTHPTAAGAAALGAAIAPVLLALVP